MKKLFIILLLLSIPLFSFAQFEQYIEEDPKPTILKHWGGAFSLLETGSGMGFYYEKPVPYFMHLGLVLDGFMLRDKNEVQVYNPINPSVPVTLGKVNNAFIFSLMASVKKRVLEDVFDDSARPFFYAAAGPVFGMNFPEYETDSKGDKLKDQFRWTVGGVIGAGVDFTVENNLFFGFKTQYRFLPFFDTLAERKDHSMIDIRLEIGKRF